MIRVFATRRSLPAPVSHSLPRKLSFHPRGCGRCCLLHTTRPAQIVVDNNASNIKFFAPVPRIPYTKPIPPRAPPSSPVLQQYISFFLYVAIPAETLLALRTQLLALLDQYAGYGRIFLATEGINAQMQVPVTNLKAFEQEFRALQQGVFAKAEFNLGDVYAYLPFSTPTNSTTATTRTSSKSSRPSRPASPPAAVGATAAVIPAFTPDGVAVSNLPPPFSTLHVKIRHRIVTDGLSEAEHAKLNLQDFGTELDAANWHREMLEFQAGKYGPQAKLLDCRNFFETEIGRFENAIPLDTELYSQSFDKIDEIFAQQAPPPSTSTSASAAASSPDDAAKLLQEGIVAQGDDPTFIMCTGGIRCLKVGAYLRAKGVKNVRLLKGGINMYHKHITNNPDLTSTFKGKNFVFDERVRDGNKAVRITDDVLGKCHQCGEAAVDDHVNCANVKCHTLFLQCKSCADKYKHTCSDECKHVVQGVAEGTVNYKDVVGKPTGQEFYRKRVGFAAAAKTAPLSATGKGLSSPSSSSRSFSTVAPASTSATNSSSSSSAIPSDAASTTTTPAVLEQYCVSHSTAPSSTSASILSLITRTTLELFPDQAKMLSDALVGNVIRSLALMAIAGRSNPKILELGMFTGYSTCHLLDALASNNAPNSSGANTIKGQLLSLELQQTYADLAMKHLSTHVAFAALEVKVAPALDTLKQLVAMAPSASESTSSSSSIGFDFIYLDANKRSYYKYFQFIMDSGLLSKHGLLVVDNTLWKGLVCASVPSDNMTQAVQEFNDKVLADPRVIVTMLPIRDGLTIIQRKPQ